MADAASNQTPDSIEGVRDALRRFIEERDWDQFHSPKNLALSLMIEAAEVGEHFQWLAAGRREDLDARTLDEIQLELADVLLYLIRLADKLDVDLLAAARRKIELNAQRYPVEKARGRPLKYDRL